MFPKSNTRLEKRRKRSLRQDRRTAAWKVTRMLDTEAVGVLRCMNLHCRSEFTFDSRFIHGMHIKPRRPNLPERDHPDNEISGCCECHDMCDGRKPAYIDGQRVTADEFMLYILEQHREESYWRWEESYQWLKGKI